MKVNISGRLILGLLTGTFFDFIGDFAVLLTSTEAPQPI